MEIQIPFEGFYESTHSAAIENEVLGNFNSEGYYDGGYMPLDLLPEKMQEDIYFDMPWSDMHEQYAKEYAESLIYTINDELKQAYGFTIDGKYKDMESPREYNFTTDSLYCEITSKDAGALYGAMLRTPETKERFQEVIKERHTSCSGFISFYSSSVKEWLEKPITEYDHNELMTLLVSMFDEETWRDIQNGVYEDINCNGVAGVSCLIPEKYNEYTYHVTQEKREEQKRIDALQFELPMPV